MSDSPTPPKFPLESMDVAEEKRRQLKQLFPEVFTESRDAKTGELKNAVDWEKLRASLGDVLERESERFGLSWPGKSALLKVIQQPSVGTLKPCREESVKFDETENLFIEGDNLEVLKLLQKSYFGKVKMIYIDPPYNTGNEFVYPDNFTESLETYLQYTGMVDAQGRKFSTNAATEGRFHSKWLNMMYPRLFLARNLLKEDGVFLASIDESEAKNLIHICNEIFGEENFIAQLTWEKGRKNDAKLFSIGHEYILIYAKSKGYLKEIGTVWREEKPGAREIWEKYVELRNQIGRNDSAIESKLKGWYSSLPAKHPSKKWSRYKRVDQYGPWRDRDISWPGGGGPRYDVIHPKTGKPCEVPERGWIYSTIEEMQRQIDKGLVEFRDDHTEPPFRKAHIKPIPDESDDESNSQEEHHDTDEESEEEEFATQVRGSYFYKQSQVSVKYLRKLFGSKVFNNPKDFEELGKLFNYVTSGDKEAVIIDFFAGSGSSAQSVLELNKQDGGNRKFVLVQLPEILDPKKKETKAAAKFCDKVGLSKTIAELCKERIRRVIHEIDEARRGQLDFDSGGKPQDLGFKVFKLSESNFKLWEGNETDPEKLKEQLELHINHLDPKATPEDILYELLLKAGFPLTTKVEKISISDKSAYSIAEGALIICLDSDLSKEAIQAIAALKPVQCICLDAAFHENDQLKTNAVQTMESAKVQFRTV